MQTGIVFDIKEFALYDGPGIRTTVFMKGCPLRCKWCHNPEGLSAAPQLLVNHNACTHCGACEQVCTREKCVGCGACIPVCRHGLRKIAGRRWESEALAERLKRDAAILRRSGGGVTFSGGEPLMQWPFVREVVTQLADMHTCIETSGYASDETFADAMATLSMIIMDIKLLDPEQHRFWTGVDNAPILRHAHMLKEGNTPFIIRLPLIPSVNDTPKHFEGVAELMEGAQNLLRVELLPYHKTAGAKYRMVGMEYSVPFDEEKSVMIQTAPFEKRGIPWKVL